MKLTGKCLDAFEKWLKKQPLAYFNKYTKQIIIHNKIYTELDERFINSLIIEWFDSVGIYVVTGLDTVFTNKFEYAIDFTEKETIFSKDTYNSRTEVTNTAIEKANDLFNQK